MKTIFKKISEWFYIAPILSTLMISFIGSFFVTVIKWAMGIVQYSSSVDYRDLLSGISVYSILSLPMVLTIQNTIFLFIKPRIEEKENMIKRWEVGAIGVGIIFSILHISLIDIVFSDWNVQLYNHQRHTPIYTKSFLTIGIIILIAVLAYIVLRFYVLEKLPPLLAVICIAGLYLGILICFLWCVQIINVTDKEMILLCLFPLNLILIALRTIKNVVHQQTFKGGNIPHKYGKISMLLNNTSNWPWIAFLAAIPLLGVLVVILLIFGQEPDSFIKAWTETADWNMSQKLPPQNIFMDEHYLCTVAAGGHPTVVKPIRTGKRHGNRVIVNRQLCIANAFEQLIQERTPNFHSFIRGLYDKVGYPIAKHINSPYMADIIYFIMKPLEWIFLIVLYLFDIKPENRIAVQYPHSTPPISKFEN